MKEKLIELLAEIRPEFDFTIDADFIEEGMLDSFDLVSLVDSIETELGVAISGMDIIPENFNSIDAIINVINKNKK